MVVNGVRLSEALLEFRRWRNGTSTILCSKNAMLNEPPCSVFV
jgi:hypothetical protein